MARIKRKFFHSDRYAQLRSEASAVGERADCTVKALSIALDVPYADAHRAMEASGRKRGQGANNSVMERAAKLLGYRAVPIEPKALIARYPGAHKNLNSATTHHPERFKKVWRDLPPMYIVVRGHALGFRDGRVHDWTEGRAKRIINMFRFEPLDERKPVEGLVDKPTFPHFSERQGWEDAIAGRTACPYHEPDDKYGHIARWNRGYDLAEKRGVAALPRFNKKKG